MKSNKGSIPWTLFSPGHLSSPGIGYASVVAVSLLNIYYIVILAWCVYYLFQVSLSLCLCVPFSA